MQANDTERRKPGRPRIFAKGAMINHHIQLSQEHTAAAEWLGGGTFVEGVRLALRPIVEQMKAEGEGTK
jgi:hypothetical protein